jgi:hypothetical protein
MKLHFTIKIKKKGCLKFRQPFFIWNKNRILKEFALFNTSFLTGKFSEVINT